MKSKQNAPTAQSDDASGAPEPRREMIAEQSREQEEARSARDAEASIRKRMVEIGRGSQQAGRHGARHQDS